jgi:hypothetical protein
METYPDVPCLPYAQLRPLIRNGDLLLCSGHAAFSKMIQHATESLWSHIGFVLRMDSIDRIMLLESVESIGTRAVALSSYAHAYNGGATGYPGLCYLARHAQITWETAGALTTFSQRAVDWLGFPYDTQMILRIALRVMAAKLGIKAEDIPQDRSFICSELVAECLASIGIQVPYADAGYISPADFARCKEITILWQIDLGPSGIASRE